MIGTGFILNTPPAEGKNPQDYHVDFDEWWERDLAALVLRDRNHPSVVIWSVCNEFLCETNDTAADCPGAPRACKRPSRFPQ